MFNSPSKFAIHKKFESIIGESGNDINVKKKQISLFNNSSLPSNAELSHEELAKNANKDENDQSQPDVKIVTKFTGRIKFEGIALEPEAPKTLICEECEKAYAKLYCRGCEQVFCERCADLCHPRAWGGSILHEHEINEWIRPVKFGDKSHVKIDLSFKMPDQELHIEDYLKFKDLTIPNTLSTITNTSTSNKPSKDIYCAPKFEVNQTVLFLDPISSLDAYGKIISEWNYRRSGVAPPILRGNGSVVWYIVEMYGLVKEQDVEVLENMVRIEANETEKLFSYEQNKLTNITSVNSQLKLDKNAIQTRDALLINKRVAELKSLQLLGPNHHLRSLHDKKSRWFSENEDEVSHISLDDASILTNNSLKANIIAINDNSKQQSVISNSYTINEDESVVINRPLRLVKPPGDKINITVLGIARQVVQPNLNMVETSAYADIDMDELSQISFNNRHMHQKPAASRSIVEYIDNTMNYATQFTTKPRPTLTVNNDEIPLVSIQNNNDPNNINNENINEVKMKRGLNILILSENEIEKLADKIDFIKNKKIIFLNSVLNKKNRKLNMKKIADNFHVWKKYTYQLRFIEHTRNAIRIQTVARVWLCRNKLEEKTKEWHDELDRRWKELHNKFNRTTKPLANSITTDNRFYFQTHANMNRYNFYLRITMMKIIKFQTRKRHTLLRYGLKKWKLSCGGLFSEDNFQVDHFNEIAIDPEEYLKSNQNVVHQYYNHLVKIHSNINNNILPLSDALLMDEKEKYNKIMSEFEMDTIQSLPLKIPKPSQALTLEETIKLKNHLISQTNVKNNTNNSEVIDAVELGGIPLTSTSYPKPSIQKPIILTKQQQLILTKQKQDAQRFLSRLTSKSKDNSIVDNDIINNYDVNNELIGLTDIPCYLPHQDQPSLPPLPELFIPSSAKERLEMDSKKRLDYFSFRSHMTGPNDESCWIIPSRLAMGPVPFGSVTFSATKKSVSSVSYLLLSGIDLFVSLLNPEEEIMYEKQYDVEPLQSVLQSSYSKSKVAANQIIYDNTEMIRKQKEKIELIPQYLKSDPRYPRMHREILRHRVRIELAETNILKARNQVKNLSDHTEWLRISLSSNKVCNINEILPIIWKLESLLSQGKNIFIYSGDGHGRCGMICSILLGRLYGLHPYEAMYRIQASHDCSVQEYKRIVVVNCPHLPMQRQLVTDVLNTTTNRVLQHNAVRSQIDPETIISKYHPRDVIHPKESKSTKVDSDENKYRAPILLPPVVVSNEVTPVVRVTSSSLNRRKAIGNTGNESTLHYMIEDNQETESNEHKEFLTGNSRKRVPMLSEFEFLRRPLTKSENDLLHERHIKEEILLHETPQIDDLYNYDEIKYNHMEDVLKTLPLKRIEPTKGLLQPKLPLIRKNII
eukprot:gene4857-6807_t